MITQWVIQLESIFLLTNSNKIVQSHFYHRLNIWKRYRLFFSQIYCQIVTVQSHFNHRFMANDFKKESKVPARPSSCLTAGFIRSSTSAITSPSRRTTFLSKDFRVIHSNFLISVLVRFNDLQLLNKFVTAFFVITKGTIIRLKNENLHLIIFGFYMF